jgi:DNA-binding LytR/AlgR family response regulator
MIAVVQANGNYSRVVYITKKEVTLTTGISKLEETLKSYNGKKNRFIRLGRSFIINHAYLTRVDVLKQILVLSDNDKNEIRVPIPKNILKSYKSAIAKSIKIKGKKEDENDYIG